MADKIIPPALKIWLAFLFLFLLLDYGIVPSILLGALAGFAGGTIRAWWTTPGGEPTTTLELPASLRQLNPRRLPLGNLLGRRSTQRLPRARR
ncbi:hypothetical protein [Nodosilinea sp. E11]|uniref:hypothetical protein n=1 Tax=Nodosilinea sp. E11 TaxID=3037479 RepID=UPI002934B702|nr:hypothetical protein [Nodosilinea sp. E11]WOD41965.1 hypothetical protein RRF56_14310 [Nodosilinea sp. E11]